MSSRLPLRPLGLLGVCLLVGACQRPAHAGLTLAGSTSLQPLAERWADHYIERGSQQHINVQGGGSTAGVRAAVSGAAQLGMVSRALTPDEARRVRGITVARDGIALIVHPSNRIDQLTLEQVRALYAGDIRRWQQLTGANREVTLITREEGSGTRAAFESLVMNKRRIIAAALVSDSTGAVSQMVGSDPAALGYISIGLVDSSVKALRISGVDASEANIDAGRYPLVRPFLFVTRAQPDAATKDFIAWITGPQGREITRREGMLPPPAEEPHAPR
jgi:phosphate transport system substrate-binding protein